MGGERIYSTTRTTHTNEKKEGVTEWFYTEEIVIHQAFTKAKGNYGGNLEIFYLEGIDAETGKITSINKSAIQSQKEKPNYVGKIIFHW